MSNDNNSLVRKVETSLEASSLTDLINASTDAPFLLIDTSSSMDESCRPGKTRISALRDVVRTIQGDTPTPMIAFGGPYGEEVRFVFDVPEPDGGTPLAQAIALAKRHGATRLVIISDGEPDNNDAAMREAEAFGGRIDVVFVGPEGSMGSFFLDEMAQKTGGERFEGSLADQKLIAGKVIGLLCGEVDENAPVIQGPGFTTVVADEDDEDDDDDDDDEEDEEDDDDDR
jgi:hypothetical protein